MPKIPESYGIIANQSPKEKLSPREKINKINAIVNFLIKEDPINISIFFSHFKIDLKADPSFHHDINYPIPPDEENLQFSLRVDDISDLQIIGLFNEIFTNNLKNFFSEEFAYQALTNEKEFEDLHHYLQECYNCLKANLEFAGTIMIRPCLHIFLKFYNKNNQEKKEVKIIENFIKEIDSNNSLAILKNHKTQIENFFLICNDNANHAVHLRSETAKKYIDEYSIEDSLKLLCLIIELTILKEPIEKIREQEKLKKINEIKFDHKKSSPKNHEKIDSKNNKTIDSNNEEEEIPF
jgi:hypothetical protein